MVRHYVGEEDNEVVVFKKQCFLIPEFKVLFDRDKGCKQDPSGRKQMIACGEMKYIYFYNDPRSEYYNTPLNASLDTVLDLSGLPKNWKIDKVFEQAIDKYKELQRLSSAGMAYFSADAALYDLGEDTKELSSIVRELKSEIRLELKQRQKKNKEYTLEDLEFVTKLINKLDAVTKTQDNILNVINKIPKLILTIKSLKEQYAQEDNEHQTLIGDRELGNREA